MAWKIEFDELAQRELYKLDAQHRQRARKFLDRLALLDDPHSIGDRLHGVKFGNCWKYRMGDYRLICRIDDEQSTVLVLRVGHRKEIYR